MVAILSRAIMRRINWNLVRRQLQEAREQLEELERLAATPGKRSEAFLQVGLEHYRANRRPSWSHLECGRTRLASSKYSRVSVCPCLEMSAEQWVRTRRFVPIPFASRSAQRSNQRLHRARPRSSPTSCRNPRSDILPGEGAAPVKRRSVRRSEAGDSLVLLQQQNARRVVIPVVTNKIGVREPQGARVVVRRFTSNDAALTV